MEDIESPEVRQTQRAPNFRIADRTEFTWEEIIATRDRHGLLTLGLELGTLCNVRCVYCYRAPGKRSQADLRMDELRNVALHAGFVATCYGQSCHTSLEFASSWFRQLGERALHHTIRFSGGLIRSKSRWYRPNSGRRFW